MNKNVTEVNMQAYLTQEALEKYSNYGLFPNERYLFDTYFAKDKTILDLACGGGRTTLRLHELGYDVKGVDLSEMLIGVARKRFPQISFEVGDYTDIKENDASFDNILISHNGLDHAYPEVQRIRAIQECSRVIKPNGYFIFSSHNIKSLHFSPYFFRERKWWMLKNTIKAFSSKKYVYDLKSWMFYCSPRYCIRQIEQHDFHFIKMIGFRQSKNTFFNTYISPYNHYVFRKK